MVDTARRRLLAALGTGALAATAGCGGLASEGDPRRTPFGVPQTTTTSTTGAVAATRVPAGEEPLPDAARRGVTSGIDDRHLALFGGPLATSPPDTRAAAGFVAPPTATSPARIAVAVTSTAREKRSVGFGFTPPFSAYYATSVSTELGPLSSTGPDAARRFLLVPVEESPYGDLTPDGPSDRGWVATDDLGSPDRPVDETAVGLAPGESLVREYTLLVHPDAPPTGRDSVQFAAPWSAVSLGLGAFAASLSDRGSSRFDRSVPDLGPRTRWFHEGDGPVFLRPDAERLVPPGGVTVTLENYSLTPVSLERWGLHKFADGRWHRVGPWVASEGVGHEVPPGAVAPLDLVVPPTGDRTPSPRRGPDRLVLGPGLYAVRYGSGTTGRVPSDAPLYVDDPDRRRGADITATTSGDDDGQTVAVEVGYAALFAVDGEGPPLVPTEEVEHVERDGEVVTVHVQAGGVGTESDRSLVVERDTTGGQGRVLLEQVYWFPALRNALAHLDAGVRRVRVATTGRRSRRPLDWLLGGEGTRFSYRGTGLRARTETA